jgi:hypothetical protein
VDPSCANRRRPTLSVTTTSRTSAAASAPRCRRATPIGIGRCDCLTPGILHTGGERSFGSRVRWDPASRAEPIVREQLCGSRSRLAGLATAAQDRPLRIAIDTVGTVKGFTDNFAGRLVGKAEKKDNLAGYTYKRLRGKETIELKVAKVDPMRFEGIELAKGPTPNYPRTIVNGRLDYDYETGNYLTDGIKFRYNFNGQDVEDVVTGTIKWVEDADRASNGKGHYEFNLRFNEEKNQPAKTEAAAFDEANAEEAFFAVDEDLPSLTGRIEYVDTFISGGTTPSASKVTYHLKANKLSRQQVMNFTKLWILCVSPTNDE